MKVPGLWESLKPRGFCLTAILSIETVRQLDAQYQPSMTNARVPEPSVHEAGDPEPKWDLSPGPGAAFWANWTKAGAPLECSASGQMAGSPKTSIGKYRTMATQQTDKINSEAYYALFCRRETKHLLFQSEEVSFTLPKL